jgi:ectoine hydroxylase-related dioxygenase (phytanoyl-CoA dioxygenase family)
MTWESPSSIVDDEAKQHFQSDGYVIVRQVFSEEEMTSLSEEANRLSGRRDLIDVNNIRCRWQNHFETEECRFDCFDLIIDLSPIFERAARDERLFEIVSTLYGEPVCLFKDKLVYKPPGATGYALHQDYISWPSFPRSFVTLLLPIDPSGDENGATEVFPGYHRQGYLSATDGDYHELPVSEVDESRGVRLCLGPGHVAVFHGMLPHRSAANRSQTWRRQLYLSYNARSEGGEQRDAHYREFHVWLKKKYAEYGKHGVYFK